MALTDDQQFQLDLETSRNNNQMAMQAKQAKLEAVRLAKETLIENRRNMPVDQREVSATDITGFAQTLVNYIES